MQSAINMIVVAGTAMAESLSALLGSLIAVQTVFVMAGWGRDDADERGSRLHPARGGPDDETSHCDVKGDNGPS